MKPEVLVLDEPAAGLDPAGRERILGTIQNFRAQTGATVIIVSHSMEDMAEVCDEIVVLLEGRILMSGAPKYSHGPTNCAGSGSTSRDNRLMLRLRDMGAEIDSIPFTVKDALPKLMKLLNRQAPRRAKTPGGKGTIPEDEQHLIRSVLSGKLPYPQP